MLNKLIFFFALTGLFAACQGTPKDTTNATGQPQSFGEPITTDGAIAYHEMLAKMENADSLHVKVRGTVRAVCQAKGCWMNISDEQAATETFVHFKDYGFFMPKDCTGREVIMEGKVYRSMTSVEELRHFAEDEGKSKEEIEAITEPVEEIKFLASGVLLLPAKG